MALETFKIINQLTPICLQNLVNVKKYKYSFRYNNFVDINEVKTTTYGKKSFRYAAAAMWNSLPDHFRTDSSFFPSLRVSYTRYSPGMGQSVAVLFADKPKLFHF